MLRPMDRLSIDGAWQFVPRIHADPRGAFLEAFRAADLPRPFRLAQINCSISAAGVMRGVHFADVPPGQAKYVMCVSGAILDVVVDLRVGSPGFGRWEAVRLDSEERRAVFVSEGLGHAFLALSEQATVVYACSEGYRPGGEHGVHPLDPDLGIDWPWDEPQLSDKDAAAPTLKQALDSGLLPSYDTCQAFYAGLH
jgi:dTDP-4-dehydrorhamnose 3,5-epimerase